MSHIRSLNAVTLFRIAFGIVWLIDGVMKFVWLQPSDVIKLVQGASQGQPAWLQPWFNFWISSVTSAPAAYLYGIGLIELALGFALVIGLLRKSAYFGGIILSLMIWAIDEGFGGPYGPGATDIGAAIMYVFIFVAIIIVERSANYGQYSLDALIERKLNGWRHLSEFYDERQNSSKRSGNQ
jgi:uncharacterized membrane protein YphA (DoxX/SURF4 family)